MATKEELEAERLQAEIDKLRAEREQLLPSSWSRAGEFVKIAGAVIATVVAIAAALTTYQITQLETKLAERDRSDALAAKQDAERQRDLAIASRKTADAERIAATLARQKADVERASAEAERDKIARQIPLAQANKSQLEAELAALERRIADTQRQLASTGSGTTPAGIQMARALLSGTNRPPAAAAPFGYIVPATAKQVSMAQTIADALKQQSFEVYVRAPLKNQNVAPSTTEIRYFRHPQDREEAMAILARLQRAGLQQGRVSYVVDPEIQRSRYFEVRLSTTAAF